MEEMSVTPGYLEDFKVKAPQKLRKQFSLTAGKLNLRTGTGGRAFLLKWFRPPLVLVIFRKKHKAKSFVAVILSPIKILGGTWYWHANFSSLLRNLFRNNFVLEGIDALDVFNVGFNFDIRPSEDVFDIGLC